MSFSLPGDARRHARVWPLALGQLALELLDQHDRPGIHAAQRRVVDRDQIAQQHQREDALHRRGPARRHPERLRRGVADQPFGQLDTVGDPISWRGRGSVTYNNGPFTATMFGNYIGSYVNDLPITLSGAAAPLPESRIPSWTTFDLSLSFAYPRGEERWGFMRGVRLGLTVNNLFGSEPPIVLSTASGNSSIDLFTHNAFGRSMQASVTKAF
jgi:outer membrane receptor protein involved in Fe transport